MNTKQKKPIKEFQKAPRTFNFIHCKPLGIAMTVGELMDILERYPRSTGFGFRNQPMQELHELKYTDKTFIVFQ